MNIAYSNDIRIPALGFLRARSIAHGSIPPLSKLRQMMPKSWKEVGMIGFCSFKVSSNLPLGLFHHWYLLWDREGKCRRIPRCRQRSRLL